MTPPRTSAETPLIISNPSVRGYRFLRAYLTTFQVVFSYLWLSFGGKLFGASWMQERLPAAHRCNARRVERTVVVLQGLFIKVGQALSIMSNFLPEEFRSGLERLQDSVPPRPFDQIAYRIEQELGKPVDDVFASFHREPIASASLGQVHEAHLPDGRRVAVKVQHKDIDIITRIDLRTIHRIMQIVSFFFPIQGMDAYYHQVREMIAHELDFQEEGASIERISENFIHDPMVLFPEVVREYSTKRVLTTTFVEGAKIGDTDALDKAGIDRSDLARRVIRTYCQMVFVDGVYHADPHPGNILVDLKTGAIILLDFGAVAELSDDMRDGIPEFLEAVVRRDNDRLLRSLHKMHFIARGSDPGVTERVVEYLHQRFQEEVRLESFNFKDIKLDPQKGVENLLDLRKMNIGLKEISGAFQVPRDWVLLERTLLLLTGLCTQLDSSLNPMDVIRPYVHDFVLGNRDWAQIAMDALKDMVMRGVALPDDLHRYLRKATNGELEVRVRNIDEGATLLYTATHQIIYAAVGIAAGIASLQLYLAGKWRPAMGALIGAGAMGVLLLGSMLFVRIRRR